MRVKHDALDTKINHALFVLISDEMFVHVAARFADRS